MPQAQEAKSSRAEQERARATKAAIVEAGLVEFANRGYDGTTVRAIAARADINTSLIAHHFGGKEELWKAVAEHIVHLSKERIRTRRKGLDGVDRRTLLRLLLRELILVSAEVPEMHRFMMHANLGDVSRLSWLVDRFLRPGEDEEVPIFAEAQTLGLIPEGDPILMRILFMNTASAIFTFAAQLKLLTGEDANDPEVIEQHIDRVLHFFEAARTK